MEKNFQIIFNEIKEDITTYVNLQLKLLKVETYEKIGLISAALSYTFLILFIVFFAVLFLFLGLGIYVGNLFGNLALGMASIGILYLIILALVVVYRKSFTNKILGLFISELLSTDVNEKNEKDNGNQES